MKLAKPSRESVKRFFHRPLVQVFLIAAVLNLVVDSFSRESLFKAGASLFQHPLIFLYNTLIIAITLLPALFFSRRIFVYVVISLLWIIIGITDFILLQFRTTPFTFVDITMIQSAITIWDHYLTIPQLIMIGVLLVLAIAGCAIFFRKCKRVTRLPFLRVLASGVIMIAVSIIATDAGVRFRILSENFGNLADAYHSYGLPYCFMSSILNTGISKPKKYSDEYVQQIIEALENGTLVTSADIAEPDKKDPTAAPTPTPEPTPSPVPAVTEEPAATPTPEPHSAVPNIIFLQLESFFDPTTITGSTFTEDPIPTFHKLMENFTSGYLSVPSVGAGTANTEFEVITGMNLDFFGPGEYPYKTILKETTCESISYILKDLGYSTHAIHNNDGTFYGRHIVFSQLGFDTFTSIEYMNQIKRTPLDWAKDDILVGEIAKALSSTPEQDFIYTISVQGHGSYPTEAILQNPAVDLTLPEEFSEDTYYQLLYYTNQIHEMDDFVAKLIEYLESIDEDTVLVMYGDHLPGLKFSAEQLSNENLFQTPYVVWSSFELDTEHENLEAYQLYSYVLDRLDIHNGIINKFHQTQKESDIYLEELEILEYDMLYGDRTSYNGVNPYEPTDLQMGIDPISVTNIRAFADSQTVSAETGEDHKNENAEYTVFLDGAGFTPYSIVQVDGKEVSTMFVSDTILSAIMPLPSEGSEITVVQQGSDEQVLSSTEPLVITADILNRIFPKANPSLDAED